MRVNNKSNLIILREELRISAGDPDGGIPIAWYPAKLAPDNLDAIGKDSPGFQHHISYREFDVEKSTEGRAEYQKLGGGGIPVIVIGGENVIRGFQPAAILTAVGK